jgi:solute:Na+ symporter, SSS family
VIVIGLGLCAAPAYWCTDFLLVQRAMAAKNLDAARKTPLVAAIPKMFFPGIVTVQGMLALVLAPQIVTKNYNLALPVLMSQFYGPGMLGIGITALLASFMSGMAGNVTAFNTVFTYDIYQGYFVRGKPDRHYLTVGRITTLVGTLFACASSYIALYFNNLMDYMQLVGILFVSPFFVAFVFGMMWKRPSATAGFASMVGGFGGALLQYILYRVGILHYTSALSADVWTAVWGFAAGLVALFAFSFLTPPPDPSKLKGLVYTPQPREACGPWFRTPEFYAGVVCVIFIALNVIFF